jgi:hypothetical protein
MKVGMIDEVWSKRTDISADYPGTVIIKDTAGSLESSYPVFTAGTPAYQDFDIVDIEWDSDAADKRVRKKTGSEESPSADYKYAFFWFDNKNKENFGAYKLPFVDVSDGKLVAVKNGVQAANGAMAGARTGKPPDIPAADRKKVQAHIDKYRKKIEKMKEKETKAMAKNLKEMVDENPVLMAELETVKRTAFEAGVTEGRKRIEARIEKVKPYIGSAAYPPAVSALAVKVLAGESEPAALEGAVTVIDAQKEEKSMAEAQKETGKTVETPGENSVGNTAVSPNGEINSEADMSAAVKRVKGGE